jgi:putative endonuclease
VGSQRKIPLCGITLQANEMYRVYLLESINTNKWYIGYTPVDPIKRLVKHDRGDVKSTKAYMPWKLIYFETYLNRSDAVGREKFLKSGSGRNFLKRQLKNYLLK